MKPNELLWCQLAIAPVHNLVSWAWANDETALFARPARVFAMTNVTRPLVVTVLPSRPAHRDLILGQNGANMGTLPQQ
jgi:hypothetical protein